MVRTRTSLLEDALEGDAELSLGAVLDYMGCDDWLVEIFMVSTSISITSSSSSSSSVRVRVKISQSHPSLLFYLTFFFTSLKQDFYIFSVCPVLYLSSVLRSIFTVS